MLVGFFLFETFKEDGLKDVLPLTSYATTVRRKFIDVAAKVVATSHERILKVSAAVRQRLALDEVWRRCQSALPIPIT